MKDSVKISVRNLVEFILRSGDIDNSGIIGGNTEAMAMGSRIHKKIQSRMGANYQAEVPLSINIPIKKDREEFTICIEGRADGILREKDNRVVVDEIKGMYMELKYIEEPIAIHKAQVMCYAYILADKENIEEIGIRLTYCNLETEEIKYFNEILDIKELKKWFDELVEEYSRWAIWQRKWERKRNKSIKQVEFPFAYREGQKDLVNGVYRTIIRNKKLFIEAPTGVGKTISTIFPTIKAMGEEKVEKIFYLTAKTITRTVAEDTFKILKEQGMNLKVITITAKEKACILEKSECNKKACKRAKGHYDRVNTAVFDLLTNEDDINRDLIDEYANKHNVCPFEMSLDVTTWVDAIICDYNYVFDPNVYLRRFFQDEKKDYVFLIDEAHNLVERARKMYSATLCKEDFLKGIKLVKEVSNKLDKALTTCNKDFLGYKRQCDNLKVIGDITEFATHLMKVLAIFEKFFKKNRELKVDDSLIDIYFKIRHFLNIYDILDENYIMYTDYNENVEFLMHLECMNPAVNLLEHLEKGRTAIFFSATLLPIQYYKEQLGGKKEDYAVYAPSPFDKENRLLMIATDVSTKYSRRSESEYERILNYIELVTKEKMGNYIVFFPSYKMMEEVLLINEIQKKLTDTDIIIQTSNMSEQSKEEFLKSFLENPRKTKIGFGVMGGIFSEGIDLKNDRLIGAIIVGTGLPMVCNERELYKRYYENKGKNGFEYSYLYQGMNKVLQSAGRVIRTNEDKGIILLLDERFLQSGYQKLFPREWFPNENVSIKTIKRKINKFWKEEDKNV